MTNIIFVLLTDTIHAEKIRRMNMKKSFAYLAAILLLVLSLAGCADDGVDNSIVSPVPTAMPSASPYISPDVDEGIVKDRDGVIEDRDSGNTGNNAAGGADITVSPAPSAKANSID